MPTLKVSDEHYAKLDGLRKTERGEVSFDDVIAWLLRADKCRRCGQPFNVLRWCPPTKEGEPGIYSCDNCGFKNWMLPEETRWVTVGGTRKF